MRKEVVRSFQGEDVNPIAVANFMELKKNFTGKVSLIHLNN